MSSSAVLTAPAANQVSGAKKNSAARPVWAQWLSSMREFALPMGAISIVFVMLIPLPALVLDLLLGLSMAAAVLVFLSAVQVRKAVDFSVFPTVLLLLTLFRLSLNIASSRRILLHGSEGTSAAGSVIEAFGQFVVGGNYVVGFVLFLALIAIQFLVVSHGAVRTAEVTARFTLDALPGKQMAIDADLNAGMIDEATLRRDGRRSTLQPARFDGHHSDHRDQYHCRFVNRHPAARSRTR
jgi:flagellar biosynthesis protein FlhA